MISQVPGGADEWGPAGGGEMGSVDEADVEKQERSEVQERWADNIVQAETASDGSAEPEAAATDATPQQTAETAPASDAASAVVRTSSTASSALWHYGPLTD